MGAILLLFLGNLAAFQGGVDFFENRVRPVLARNCFSCHGPDKQFSDLRVDSRAALVKGGKRGPSIIPGSPSESLLVKAIRHQGLAMPVGSRLHDPEIAAIEEWIRTGAAWPAEKSAEKSAGKNASKGAGWYDEAAKTHWSFQPVRKPALPPVKNTSWAKTEIDRFVLAALERKALRPATPADRITLIRRASFVLTGLPPSPGDAQTSDSYPQIVDRLLASPHFGEQWARHWMDVVRYGETRGYEWNYEVIGAWQYRDYLIRAFNADVPYNQFVQEHIAGDLLPNPRVNAKERLNESVIGTAFYRLGEAGHDDCVQFREISLDVVDNQIDTVSKAFQGMTVSCARCHNHKLDPIPTEDYYGLFGILNSSRAVTHTLDAKLPPTADEQRLRSLKMDIRKEVARLWQQPLALPAKGTARTTFDNPLFPWLAMQNTTDFAATWRELSALYAREKTTREEFNLSNFTELADFRKGSSGWWVDGLGLREGVSPSGEFAVSVDGSRAIEGIFPRGFHTHTLSDRWNGAVRSPLLGKDKKYISIRLLGGRLSARRTVLDNCAIGEGYKVIETHSPAWVRLDTLAKEKMPVFAEIVTKSDNPRIPDRPGVLKNKPEELTSPRSYFGVMRAVLHDGSEPPREELSHFDRLFATPVTSREDLAARYAGLAHNAVEAWARGDANDDDVRWLDALLSSGVLTNDKNASSRLAELINAYRATEAQLPNPRVVDGLGDAGAGFDMPVLRTGDPHAPGDLAPRHFLSRVGPKNESLQSKGSGRRELADLIASPENPLTARLMVNRIWHHIFGRGLVSTVDNFGREGERPSHPELLDYLATRFMEQGWSVKKLVREILLSQTFQQSGETTPQAREADPQNRLLHHYPLRRLSAESVRDAILAASGRLDRTMFGPSIPPHRQEAQEYRRLFNGPLDGNGRRSIYTQITRMEGPKFLEIFDYPNPMAARGARDITNVPAQALALLNDPFVIEQAEVWSKSLLLQMEPPKRIPAMFQTALQRPPSPAEQERFQALAAELTSLHNGNTRAVWKDMAHAMFNLKEFLYIR